MSTKVSLDSLHRRIADFQAAAGDLNQAVARAIGSGRLDSPASERVNAALMQVERNWCNPAGIPGRPWWKHSLYGARYTYAHLELPGLTEAAEARDWNRAAEQAKILEAELAKNSALLRRTVQMLGSLAPSH